MERRKLLALTSAGVLVGINGCLGYLQASGDAEQDRGDNDEISNVATAGDENPSDEGQEDDQLNNDDDSEEQVCPKVPTDAETLVHESTLVKGFIPLIKHGYLTRGGYNSAGSRFVHLGTNKQVKDRLMLDQFDDNDDEVAKAQTFIENTNFNDESLLIWQTHKHKDDDELAIVGVGQFEDGSLHGYACRDTDMTWEDSKGNSVRFSKDVIGYTSLIRVSPHSTPPIAKFTVGEEIDSTIHSTTYTDDYEPIDHTDEIMQIGGRLNPPKGTDVAMVEDGERGYLNAFQDTDDALGTLDFEFIGEEKHDAVKTFIQQTDFDTSIIVYLVSIGPQTQYREIEVQELVIETDRIAGSARAFPIAEGGGDAPAWPAILLRITPENGIPETVSFTITDGWDEEHTLETTIKSCDP